MARKVDTAPAMPDDYVMKALPKQMVDALELEQAKEWMTKLADKTATGERDEEFQRLVEG